MKWTGSIGMVIMVILIIEDEDEDKAEGGRPQHAAIALRKSIKWAKNILHTRIVDRLTLRHNVPHSEEEGITQIRKNSGNSRGSRTRVEFSAMN